MYDPNKAPVIQEASNSDIEPTGWLQVFVVAVGTYIYNININTVFNAVQFSTILRS